jgi:low affinity Fe/Cu permease
MNDLATYIHVGVTIVTAIGAVLLAITQYHDKKLTKEVDSSLDFKQKIIDLEKNQAVIIERLNDQKETITKADDRINILINKL